MSTIKLYRLVMHEVHIFSENSLSLESNFVGKDVTNIDCKANACYEGTVLFLPRGGF